MPMTVTQMINRLGQVAQDLQVVVQDEDGDVYPVENIALGAMGDEPVVGVLFELDGTPSGVENDDNDDD